MPDLKKRKAQNRNVDASRDTPPLSSQLVSIMGKISFSEIVGLFKISEKITAQAVDKMTPDYEISTNPIRLNTVKLLTGIEDNEKLWGVISEYIDYRQDNINDYSDQILKHNNIIELDANHLLSHDDLLFPGGRLGEIVGSLSHPIGDGGQPDIVVTDTATSSVDAIRNYLTQALEIAKRENIEASEYNDHPIFENIKAPVKASSLSEADRKIVEEIRSLGKEQWGKSHRNPVTFLKRVYSTELESKILKRHMLAHLDYALSQAYASWIRPKRHPEDSLWPDVDGKGRKLPLSDEERISHTRDRIAKNQRNFVSRLTQ